MQTLYLNRATRIVSSQPFSRVPAQVQSKRGSETINLVVVDGTPAVPTLADAGLNVGIVIRPPANLKQGVLNGAVTETRGADGDAGYTLETSTDTELTRELMHVDEDDPASELLSFLATAVVYLVPAGGGDAIESLPFGWTVQPNYYRPLQPPATAAVNYPSAAAVAVAVAEAATALQPGREDVYAFFATNPDGGEFGVVGAVAYQVAGSVLDDGVYADAGSNGSLVVITGARGLTSLTCTSAGIRSMGTLPAALTHLDVSNNNLGQAAQDGIFAQFVDNGQLDGAVYLNSQGGNYPSNAGITNAGILTSRGWTVTYGG